MDRATQKLIDAREKLAALEAGGSVDGPLTVESASLVELRALREPCLACGSQVAVAEHRADHRPSGLVREVTVQCKQCGRRRTWWIRVAPPLLQ